MSRRLKKLNPSFRIGKNVYNLENYNVLLEEGLVDCFLLASTPTEGDVSYLHQHGKQVLFNYAGPERRKKEAWKRAAEAGVDGLLTDYPLDCRAFWREAATLKQPVKQ